MLRMRGMLSLMWWLWAVFWVGYGQAVVPPRRVLGTEFEAMMGEPANRVDMPAGTYRLPSNGFMTAEVRSVGGGSYMVCVSAGAEHGPSRMVVEVDGEEVITADVRSEVTGFFGVSEHPYLDLFCGVGPPLIQGSDSLNVRISFTGGNDSSSVNQSLLIAYADAAQVEDIILAASFSKLSGSPNGTEEPDGSWLFAGDGEISSPVSLGEEVSRICLEMRVETSTGEFPRADISFSELNGVQGDASFSSEVYWTDWRFACFGVLDFAGSTGTFSIQVYRYFGVPKRPKVLARRLILLGPPVDSELAPKRGLPSSCEWKLDLDREFWGSVIGIVPTEQFGSPTGPPTEPAGSILVSPTSGSVFYTRNMRDSGTWSIFKRTRMEDGTFGQEEKLSPVLTNFEGVTLEAIGQNETILYFRRRISRHTKETDQWLQFEIGRGSLSKIGQFSARLLVFHAARESPEGALIVVWGTDKTSFQEIPPFFRVEKLLNGSSATLFSSEESFRSFDIGSDGTLVVLTICGQRLCVLLTSSDSQSGISPTKLNTSSLPSDILSDPYYNQFVKVDGPSMSLFLTLSLRFGIQVWVGQLFGSEWSRLGASEYISAPRREGKPLDDEYWFEFPSRVALGSNGATLYAAYVRVVRIGRWTQTSKPFVLSYDLSSGSSGNWTDLEFFDSLSDHLEFYSFDLDVSMDIWTLGDDLFVRNLNYDGSNQIFLLTCSETSPIPSPEMSAPPVETGIPSPEASSPPFEGGIPSPEPSSRAIAIYQ